MLKLELNQQLPISLQKVIEENSKIWASYTLFHQQFISILNIKISVVKFFISKGTFGLHF
jgi:hypothetical protein